MAEMMVEKSLEVDASPDQIWEAMMDVKSWPEWKPFMTKARFGSGYESVTCGAKIKMSLMVGGPAVVPLSVEVCEFDKPSRLAWQGGVQGLFHAVHGFELQDKGGKTRVVSHEKFTGILVPLVKLIISSEDFENLHQEWLLAIKRRVEKKDAPEEEAAPAHSH